MKTDASAGFVRDPLFWLALAAIAVITPLLAVLPDIVLRPHWPPVGVFTLAVFVYPPLEEIVFRTGLHSWLLRRVPPCGAGLSAANTITAAAFVLMHLWYHPPFWALGTALPALLFGWFYERHGQRLGAPIVLHGASNAAYFSWLV